MVTKIQKYRWQNRDNHFAMNQIKRSIEKSFWYNDFRVNPRDETCSERVAGTTNPVIKESVISSMSLK